MKQLWAAMGEREPSRGSPWRESMKAYGLALLLEGLAIAARRVAHDLFGDHAAFLFSLVAIILSALMAGTGPAFLCVALGALNALLAFWMEGLSAGALLATLFFVAIGLGVAVLGGRYRRMTAWAERTTRSLLEREAHLQSILNTVPDAMVITDETGRIQAFSAAAEQTFQFEPDEILDRSIDTLLPGAAAARDGEGGGGITSFCAADHDGLALRKVGQRKDGEIFPMQCFVGEVEAANGRFCTIFVRDLTLQQKAEAHARNLQDELLHMSRLTAMGEMATTLAHELNQPLTAAANFLNAARTMLESGSADQVRIQSLLNKAADQMLRGGQIIRRIREFIGRGESERRIESLPKLIDEASSLAMAGVNEAGIQVLTRYDPAVDLVLVDKVQIQQVTINLIRNAVDALQGCQERRLVLSLWPEGEEMARVTVADSGPGVSPQVADRLFQPFVTSKAQGMGVGLSISRTIVEAHGGRIWVEAGQQAGAAFNFTVPCARPEEMPLV